MVDISNVDVYPYTLDATGRISQRRLVSTLGDGYAESRVTGINPINKIWDAQFYLASPTATSLINSLESNVSFILWKSPLDLVAQRYLCTNWDVTFPSPELTMVSMQLKRWYGN
jgi:phage-related protein